MTTWSLCFFFLFFPLKMTMPILKNYFCFSLGQCVPFDGITAIGQSDAEVFLDLLEGMLGDGTKGLGLFALLVNLVEFIFVVHLII